MMWSTGRLLHTRDVLRWTEEQRQEMDHREKCSIFTNFRATDQGRSRRCKVMCSTPGVARLVLASIQSDAKLKEVLEAREKPLDLSDYGFAAAMVQLYELPEMQDAI